MKNCLTTICCLILLSGLKAQENDFSPFVGISSGIMNYSGDLKPSSFTLSGSNPYFSVYFRKPLNKSFAIRSGISMGKVEGDDKKNRDYLKQRNLNFESALQEGYLALEVSFFSSGKISPYLFAGGAVFHYNPWTRDVNGEKVYLKPLSTEGQGLDAYPHRKPYQLTQFALVDGLGFRYHVSDKVNINLEFSQRKTFTDYLDDVSASYVDRGVLLAARGQKAADLAYRGDELPGGHLYPEEGEQRGTPTQQDWYYFMGLSMEIRFGSLKNLFPKKNSYSMGCPRVN